MIVQRPFNLNHWIEENKDKLKPPVSNKNLYPLGKDFIVMIVGGPNARKDYHYNETEEMFFQIKGDINVQIQENGKAVDIAIREGEMFLLPANVPHSPMRGENTVGLVVERVRDGTDYKDGLIWFCDNCNHKLYEEYFQLKDIEKDFLNVFNRFYSDEKNRTCDNCDTIMQSPE
jgi:3-hydroxyanthranilate 3,4-dioxygenase